MKPGTAPFAASLVDVYHSHWPSCQKTNMDEALSKPKRVFMILAAGLGWFALVLQFYLLITVALAKGTSFFVGVINYFSFFTILTNIIVALALSVPLLMPRSPVGRFFSRPMVQSGIAVCIVLVGIIYELLLRRLWNPEGMQFVADVILHNLMPLIYVLFWLIFVPKGRLRWKDPLLWLIYPVAYLLYALVRGAMTGLYPYPFIDVGQLGYGHVLVNAVALMLAFLVLGLVFVGVDRAMGRAAWRVIG